MPKINLIVDKKLVRSIFRSLFFGFQSEAIFAVTMIAATALGFMKTIALVAILPSDVFGVYITGLGGATMVALFSTFGDVELTYKLYPQQYAIRRVDKVLAHIKGLILKLFIRGFLICLLTITVSIIFNPLGFSYRDAALITITGLGMVLQMLMASIIRAIDPRKILPLFTLARGTTALIFCGFIALQTTDWRTVLAAEALGMFVVFIVTAILINRRLNQEISSCDDNSIDSHLFSFKEDRTAGKKIFLATLIAASIPYGGRIAVLWLAGPVVAGAYGLLTVLVQTGQMIAGSLSQKLGPALLREAATRGESTRLNALQRFGLPIIFLWAASIFTFIICWLSTFVPRLADFWLSYNISLFIIGLTTLQMSMTVYLYLGYAAMAENRENDLIAASLVAAIVFYGGFLFSFQFNLALVGYIASATTAYAIHTIYLFICYRKVLLSTAE